MLRDKYYGENGELLYDTQIGNKEYIIKTSKSKENLMGGSKTDPMSIADVKGITSDEAANTIELVRNGNTKGSHMDNFVELDSRQTRVTMQSVINCSKDNGSGGSSPLNNREVGSIISSIGTVGYPIYGETGNLSGSQTLTINFGFLSPGTRTFHGHSSGSLGNKSWNQLPSKKDQENASRGNHYEFPMKNGENSVYLYNSQGIIAIIPKSFFR